MKWLIFCISLIGPLAAQSSSSDFALMDSKQSFCAVVNDYFDFIEITDKEQWKKNKQQLKESYILTNKSEKVESFFPALDLISAYLQCDNLDSIYTILFLDENLLREKGFIEKIGTIIHHPNCDGLKTYIFTPSWEEGFLNKKAFPPTEKTGIYFLLKTYTGELFLFSQERQKEGFEILLGPLDHALIKQKWEGIEKEIKKSLKRD